MRILRAILVLSLSLPAYGQTFRGALSGAVTDSTGAALPGATVKLDNPATGLSRTVTASEIGDFFFADLPLGTYTLTVTLGGFETRKVDNIEVAVSKTTNINVQLGVERQQEIVEVSATADNLETTSSDLSAVVNRREVQNLPINGRDFRQMIKLSPGVTSSASPSVGSRTRIRRTTQRPIGTEVYFLSTDDVGAGFSRSRPNDSSARCDEHSGGEPAAVAARDRLKNV